MEREGQQWHATEDCSTDERLQQETLCRRQWTDEYVERPETRYCTQCTDTFSWGFNCNLHCFVGQKTDEALCCHRSCTLVRGKTVIRLHLIVKVFTFCQSSVPNSRGSDMKGSVATRSHRRDLRGSCWNIVKRRQNSLAPDVYCGLWGSNVMRTRRQFVADPCRI